MIIDNPGNASPVPHGGLYVSIKLPCCEPKALQTTHLLNSNLLINSSSSSGNVGALVVCRMSTFCIHSCLC
jgi:hypothetical protein